jgi:hypothetical protein
VDSTSKPLSGFTVTQSETFASFAHKVITGYYGKESTEEFLGFKLNEQKVDTTCYYQAPKITCKQAQYNAEAIVNYPLLLKSNSIKDEMIRTKENELYHTVESFTAERQIFKIDYQALEKSFKRQESISKRWKYATFGFAVLATAFYINK